MIPGTAITHSHLQAKESYMTSMCKLRSIKQELQAHCLVHHLHYSLVLAVVIGIFFPGGFSYIK